jgi:hypothetical protein
MMQIGIREKGGRGMARQDGELAPARKSRVGKDEMDDQD